MWRLMSARYPLHVIDLPVESVGGRSKCVGKDARLAFRDLKGRCDMKRSNCHSQMVFVFISGQIGLK